MSTPNALGVPLRAWERVMGCIAGRWGLVVVELLFVESRSMQDGELRDERWLFQAARGLPRIKLRRELADVV